MSNRTDRSRARFADLGDEQQFAAVYRELRAIAHRVRTSNPQPTLNTTALVHEAWLKLNAADHPFTERGHYLRTAALAMRQILVDYARYRGAGKRDRNEELPLVESTLSGQAQQSAEDVLALDEALTELERLDERAASLVLLRFFAGASIGEAAAAVNISPRSAARDWRRARAFLHSRLQS